MAGGRGVAVVTGGSAGVGRATVRELAKAGFDVAVLARGREGVDQAAREVEEMGRRGLGVVADVADHEAVEKAAEEVERELGPIDVWVNNAFVGSLTRFEDLKPEEYQRITDVTYHGQVNGTRAALARMRPRNAGVVVNVGSALAFRGIPLQAAYCGAKHAIVGFTETVRTELIHDKSAVQVCMVHLPALNTPQFTSVLNRMPKHPQPVPPIYQPEVAARGITHVAMHPRRTMWVGLPTALTILGNRAVPYLLDLYLGRTGFKAQQADRSLDSMEGPNLFEPVHRDQGAHGIFDDKAWDGSVELWVSRHRGAVLGSLAAAAAGVGGLLRRR